MGCLTLLNREKENKMLKVSYLSALRKSKKRSIRVVVRPTRYIVVDNQRVVTEGKDAQFVNYRYETDDQEIIDYLDKHEMCGVWWQREDALPKTVEESKPLDVPETPGPVREVVLRREKIDKEMVERGQLARRVDATKLIRDEVKAKHVTMGKPDDPTKTTAPAYTRQALLKTTLPDLKQIAKERGVVGYSKMKKMAMVKAVLEAS